MFNLKQSGTLAEDEQSEPNGGIKELDGISQVCLIEHGLDFQHLDLEKKGGGKVLPTCFSTSVHLSLQGIL